MLELESGGSPDAKVDTDCNEGGRGRCSGVPNWNPTSESASPPPPPPLCSRSAEKLTRRADSGRPVGVVAPVSLPPDAAQRLRGGGCNDIALSESPLLALSRSFPAADEPCSATAETHAPSGRAGSWMVRRSMRRPSSAGPANGNGAVGAANVRALWTVCTDCVSDVPTRSMLSRLLPRFANDSSSWSMVRSELMDVAREAARGRPPLKRPLSADTALVGEAGTPCERTECDETEDAYASGGGLAPFLNVVRVGEIALARFCVRMDIITSMSPRGSLFPSESGGIRPARTVLYVRRQSKRLDKTEHTHRCPRIACFIFVIHRCASAGSAI